MEFFGLNLLVGWLLGSTEELGIPTFWVASSAEWKLSLSHSEKDEQV